MRNTEFDRHFGLEFVRKLKLDFARQKVGFCHAHCDQTFRRLKEDLANVRLNLRIMSIF